MATTATGAHLTSWTILEIFASDAPGLAELLEADSGASAVHGSWRDLLVRHGDDGGWAIDGNPDYAGTDTPPSDLHTRLEAIRVEAGLPAHGRVFYLLVKRD